MLQNRHPCPSPILLILHKTNHFYVYWSMCCFCTLHKCECVCIQIPPMLSVYFYVFTCGWYVCVQASDEKYRVVFIDGCHGAWRHFLCLLIINQFVSSLVLSSLFLLLHFFFLFIHFCLSLLFPYSLYISLTLSFPPHHCCSPPSPSFILHLCLL